MACSCTTPAAAGGDGDPQGFDWTWRPDIDAAIDFLKARPVRDDRIGGVGLSAAPRRWSRPPRGGRTCAPSSPRLPACERTATSATSQEASSGCCCYTWTMFAAPALSGDTDVQSVGDFVGKAEPGACS
jgi:hypothetical protein